MQRVRRKLREPRAAGQREAEWDWNQRWTSVGDSDLGCMVVYMPETIYSYQEKNNIQSVEPLIWCGNSNFAAETSYCFPANPVVCGYSSAVIRAELSFFRKLSRKEKGSLPKRASSRDPLSERALKQLRFLLSHVLGMIASPASTGRLVLGNS